MRELCDEYDALLIFDEVQTGCGLTGTPGPTSNWASQPDVVAFGKKTQVCGVMAGRRVEEIADNVFAVASRINSTWGGNLADMVRARRILEVIEADELFDRAAERGRYLRARLDELARDFPGGRARPPRPRPDVRVQSADHIRSRRGDPSAVATRRDCAALRPRRRSVPSRTDRFARRDRRGDCRPCAAALAAVT